MPLGNNTLLTPDLIAKQALATLYETCVMAQLVHRDLDTEFAGKQGDTVTVRKPAVFVADEYDRSQGINVQNAVEGAIPVTLNHLADVSFTVTSEEMTLEVEDFGVQFLNPAMEAISQKIDRDLLELRNDIVQEVGVVGGANIHAWDVPQVAIDADRVLNERNVPPSQRSLVTGPQTKAHWLSDPLFHQVDTSGTTDGLREASLGRRIFGFDAFGTQNIKVPAQTSGNSTTEVGVAFHRTALCLVMRPLVLPQGAARATVANYKGFSLRVVMDYDIDLKQDIISIDCLYGTKTLDPHRAVLVKGPDVT
ncbi:P22 phage major capsid protein family protein [Spongiactinospora sp. TRM90649]|uniref:P22 phage major capsid protein family protein n=1 Tax=Spongiactinospora sp. TRM90649 TaxID=3031114 RepID=UPI0023F6E9EA|nr:P22 phage major capsid protein family protein [Spongiactinospora sp. TRM90649]MDF5756652.1 P22 phage major capsid protein family protein [Spongiactinospora sp. TRM90649]